MFVCILYLLSEILVCLYLNRELMLHTSVSTVQNLKKKQHCACKINDLFKNSKQKQNVSIIERNTL